MKKISLLLLLLSTSVFGQQNYRLDPSLTNATWREIFKYADSLFAPSGSFTYNCTTNYLVPYDKVIVDNSDKPEYLEKQLKALKKDSLNPFYYSNIALYYSNRAKEAEAQEYFKKAYSLLPHFKIHKDSAKFYSYRGLLKTKLGEQGIPDVEKALSINKHDSLAVAFYPMFLIGNNRFDDAKKVLLPLLENNTYKYSSYMMLYMNELFRKMAADLKDENIGLEKIIDMSPYDKYFDNKSKDFELIKAATNLYLVSLKMIGQLTDEKYKPSAADIAFTNRQEKVFKEALKRKGANKYGIYMALGTTAFAKREFDVALDYYHKAIDEFPLEKQGVRFNREEVFSNISIIHIYMKDYGKALAILQKLLQEKNLSPETEAKTLLEIGKIYCVKNQMEEADSSVARSLEVQETFGATLFKSYLYLKDGMEVLGQRYMEKSQGLIKDEDDFCKLITFCTAFKLAAGDYDGAFVVQQDNSSQVPGGCKTCDYIIKHYLVPAK